MARNVSWQCVPFQWSAGPLLGVKRCLRPVRALWTHQLRTVHALREQNDRNRHAMERLLYAYFPLSLRTLRIVPTTLRMRELVGTFLVLRLALQHSIYRTFIA